MAIYETQKNTCPNCKHILFRGPLTIGPTVIKCKKCNQQVLTGLDSWLECTFLGKISFLMREILGPSFLGASDLFQRLCSNAMICIFVVAIPLSGIAGHSQAPVSEIITSILMGSMYPAFLIIRILRLRSQSLAHYNKNGVIPKW
jgi:hypothetical protein